MQFTKLLPTVLVVVGICTWTFMSAQDEDHRTESNHSPQRRTIANRGEFSSEPTEGTSVNQEITDASDSEQTEFIIPLPKGLGQSNTIEIAQVSGNQTGSPLANVIPALALGQTPTSDTELTLTFHERPTGDKNVGEVIKAEARKNPLLTIQFEFRTPEIAKLVKDITLEIGQGLATKKVTIPQNRLRPSEPSENFLWYDDDFSPYINKGTFIFTASARTNAADPVVSSGSATLQLVEFPLPPVSIKSVHETEGDGSSVGDELLKPLGLTNSNKLKLGFAISPPKDLENKIKDKEAIVEVINGGTVIQRFEDFTFSGLEGNVVIDATKFEGPLSLSIRYQLLEPDLFESRNSALSPPFAVLIDRTPPAFVDARLVSDTQLEIRFRDDDLDNVAKLAASYTIANTAKGDPPVLSDGEIRANAVLFTVSGLTTANYRIAPNAATVNDKAGNSMLATSVVTFNSFPDRERGQQVEFPEFVSRSIGRDKTKVFNPGDKVETRVARLYYYRDAHRVAEIINRNVKSYNRAAVKVTEQQAEDARDNAERLTGERQANERRAIFEAQQTRVLERDISQKERLLAAHQADKFRLEDRLRDTEKEIELAKQLQQAIPNTTKPAFNRTANPAPSSIQPPATNVAGDPSIEQVSARRQEPDPAATTNDFDKSRDSEIIKARQDAAEALKTNLEAKIVANDNAIATLSADLVDLQKQATAARNNEFQSREKVATAEFEEERAKANQFRKQVANASADPDTYAPGDINSPDQVSQVSVSVIGEGLIQLRGPIRGINVIREMISQIDSPVGQVKVGIHTVQINGEHGDRMEQVASRIEASLKLSQNLTSQSLMLLRRSIQEVAAEMVEQANGQSGAGHRQVDRDRRYLYSFFGRDFTDELYEMDSEFLRSQNKLLGLHSMDTLSIPQAVFILALAKNDVRQQVLDKFRHLVMCELPEAEWDHRRSTKLLPKKFNTLEEVILNANARYHFRNLHAFLNAQVYAPDTLTPTQREFLRLAQIFKSQMVAEMEYKQRVLERGLLEDQSNTEDDLRQLLDRPHKNALALIGKTFDEVVDKAGQLGQSGDWLGLSKMEVRADSESIHTAIDEVEHLVQGFHELLKAKLTDQEIKLFEEANKSNLSVDAQKSVGDVKQKIRAISAQYNLVNEFFILQYSLHELINDVLLPSHIISTKLANRVEKQKDAFAKRWTTETVKPETLNQAYDELYQLKNTIVPQIQRELDDWMGLFRSYDRFRATLEAQMASSQDLKKQLDDLQGYLGRIRTRMADGSKYANDLDQLNATANAGFEASHSVEVKLGAARAIERRTRGDLDHRKIMEFHIDEQAEKVVELQEGTRSHIAQMDNYLKRMFIALEDDFQAQFYDPAFEDVRRASRMWDVSLGQIERTTILGNNRSLMVVHPQATMEFDLPKREIMIAEAMNGAKAAMTEYGALLTDPTFLSLTKMKSGSPPVGGDARFAGQGGGFQDLQQSPSVKNVLPGLSSTPDEQMFSQIAGNKTQFGSALEGLIPDPAVYKFETGTGFQVKPVIQPDGSSLVFDFDYMYTTNVREPIRADEKHLGRVKRHFIHTQVQTTSFELREISRYLVALKASRTGRGVPLLQDAPGIGVLFRPLPSAESSLQQNIILSQSMAYPTLFDLMGLRWSKHLVDLDHVGLRDSEHVVRGRYQTIRDFTFDESSTRFDDFLDIKQKQPDHLREDLYHRNSRPSPYHPGGYHNPRISDEQDPTGRRFSHPDTRPPEMQDPYYDPKFRRPIDAEPVGPGQLLTPQPVGAGEWIDPNNPPEFPPPTSNEMGRRGGLRTPDRMGPGEPIEDPSNPATSPRIGTLPRGSRPRGRTYEQTEPGRNRPILESEPEFTEPASVPVPAEGTPMGRRQPAGLQRVPMAGRTPNSAVKWVVNEQPSGNTRVAKSGYKQIEPRYLPPPTTSKGLPSLKQLFSGGKSTTTQNSWMGGKTSATRESATKSSWSRSRVESESRR